MPEKRINLIEDDEVKTTSTFLRGFASAGGCVQILIALGYARRKHAGQLRKNGRPFILHPLKAATYAISCGIKDDVLLAAILLHDVPEDTMTPVTELPCNDEVKHAVELMTFRRCDGESKLEAKRRYYYGLMESKYALLCKAYDRVNNIWTLCDLSREAIIKNIYETAFFLMPLLDDAKSLWPEFANQISGLREVFRGMIHTYSVAYGFVLPKNEPSDEEWQNILGC